MLRVEPSVSMLQPSTTLYVQPELAGNEGKNTRTRKLHTSMYKGAWLWRCAAAPRSATEFRNYIDGTYRGPDWKLSSRRTCRGARQASAGANSDTIANECASEQA